MKKQYIAPEQTVYSITPSEFCIVTASNTGTSYDKNPGNPNEESDASRRRLDWTNYEQ